MTVPKFVNEAIDRILVNEGGYQDSKTDKGNIVKKDGTVVGTNMGITPQALATYRGVDVSSITAKDMKNLKESEARSIYRDDYYYRPKLNKIKDEALRENVFDMVVNAGQGNAIKLLQKLAGTEQDGIIGNQTLKALEEKNINTNNYADARKSFYKSIVEARPEQSKFLQGWINRANKYYKETDNVEEAINALKGSSILTAKGL